MNYIPRHRKSDFRAIVPDSFYEESDFDYLTNRIVVKRIRQRLNNLSDIDKKILKIRFKNDKRRLIKYLQTTRYRNVRFTVADLIAFPFLEDIGLSDVIAEDDYRRINS